MCTRLYELTKAIDKFNRGSCWRKKKNLTASSVIKEKTEMMIYCGPSLESGLCRFVEIYNENQAYEIAIPAEIIKWIMIHDTFLMTIGKLNINYELLECSPPYDEVYL